MKLKTENKLLRESLLQEEEKNKKLEEEIMLLKVQKQTKTMKDYFVTKK